jgi:hypothetical protein
MICRYALTIRCACPVDARPDVYRAEFESSTMIKVEDILAAVQPFQTNAAFQEDLTATLARQLGCQVKTIGWHSGVETIAVAP